MFDPSYSALSLFIGVIGLTTAIKIQEAKGSEYNVTIIAETFPTDPRTIKYTSFWAGAQYVATRTEDLNLRRMERETFDVVWAMSEPGSGVAEGCLLRCTDYSYLPAEEQYADGKDHPCAFMPDFRQLRPDELVSGASQGFACTAITFDIPRYLPYLLARFTSGGGTIVRGAVGHIQQVLEGGAGIFANPNSSRKYSPPDAVILCVGLGARFLGGIEDKDVIPIRGQTVLLRAPWVHIMPTLRDLKDGFNPPYVIPRKGGDVIVGGTFHLDDWYPHPRLEITERILSKGLKLCPDLAPPEVRAEREPTVDDLRSLILDVGVGFRPYRNGGVRVGVEWMDSSPLKNQSKKVPVVFNYGHGGNGYQASWGSAQIALEYLEGAFINPK
ncbi:FAD dependent oxidoreductase [Lentinula guzmanii]|uniref:FAD dependent oxidoreductase n=1 Tax=Lentinula guzmanii TaxID=2804957 RepID=A0AA38JI69_9AGAR|nr:FAD dependent oxidoreductase [Lentinula guzmanii]